MATTGSTKVDCYTYEVETINLRTGERKWTPLDSVPVNACPSCCDPAGKLLRRVVSEKADCSAVLFADETGRKFRKRTERIYSDGNCGTYSLFNYELPCTPPAKLLRIGTVNLFGICSATVTFTTPTGQYSVDVSLLEHELSIPIGPLKIGLTANSCGGDLALKFLTGPNAIGGVFMLSNEPAKSFIVTADTYGFYVDLL